MPDELFFDRNIFPGIFRLNREESAHAVRVLRKKAGDQLHLTNGMGFSFDAEILEASPTGCLLNVEEALDRHDPRQYWISMAVAPTKNISRFEWFLEKAVEIGVDRVIPLMCEHVEHRKLNSDRIEKVAIAAMKQSFKYMMPEITPAMNLKEAIVFSRESLCFLARKDEDDVPHLADALSGVMRVTVFIGPEGDFSLKEKSYALSSGLTQIHLGPYRLRTETAAFAACQTLHVLYRNQIDR